MGVSGRLALRSDDDPAVDYPNVIGPVYTSVVSLAAKVITPIDPVRITARVRGFGAYLIDMHTIAGGFGCSLLVEITAEFSVLVAANYYLGGAPAAIPGSYDDGIIANAPVPAYLDGISIDLSILEISIGAELPSGL